MSTLSGEGAVRQVRLGEILFGLAQEGSLRSPQVDSSVQFEERFEEVFSVSKFHKSELQHYITTYLGTNVMDIRPSRRNHTRLQNQPRNRTWRRRVKIVMKCARL